MLLSLHFICFSSRFSFKSKFMHIHKLSASLGYSKPWHIPITKYIRTLRYVHNTILNIFTKAQLWRFDAVLNAPLFYRCCLTSRITLRIFNVSLYFRLIQAYSTLIQPYLVLLRHIKSPDIFRSILLQPYLGIF